MQIKKILFTCMLCLSTLLATAQFVSLDKTVISSNCWATNPVIATSTQQNAIAVYQNFVYLTYYDATSRKLTIARNNNHGLGTNWVYVELPHTYEQRNGVWDNHNTPNIIVSPNDGRIHLAFDMHAGDLRYIISSPGAATISDANFTSSLFGSTQNYLESNQTLIDRVTYPRFFVGDNNKLFFMYRDGGSGNGHTFLVKYRDDGFWDAPVKIIEASHGGSTRCAYFNNVHFKNGRIYWSWVWRESPDGATNHDLMFMYSDDNGVTWKNSAGNSVSLPVTHGNSSIVVKNIAQDSGLANHNGCAVDGNGNVHVVLRHGSNYKHHFGIQNGNQFTWSEQTIASFTGDRPKMYADPIDNDIYFLVRQGSNNSLRLFETPANGGLYNQWTEIHSDADSYKTSTNSVMNATGDRLMSMVVSNDNRLQILNWNLGAPSNNSPSVSITSPANGASFNDGDNITITADASDSDGSVSQVEFFVNGSSVGIDTSSPYSVNWTIGVGSYDLTAVATDNESASTTSSAINVTGNSTVNTPPTVSVTSPANGASFNDGDSVTISADASDSDGSVTQVEFFVNGSSVGIDTSSPYSVNWTIGVGSYDLTSVATDNESASTTSSAINVTGNSTSTPTEAYVNSIITDHLNVGKGNKRGIATVTILDNIGNPVANASVTGTFSGTFNETVSGTTGTNGNVELQTSSTAKGGVTVNLCVDNVTHGSLIYNSSLNVITCTGASAKFSKAKDADSNIGENQSVSVFPNPATDRLYITLKENNSQATFKIYNLTGQLIIGGKISNAVNTIKVDNLPVGIYIIQTFYNNTIKNFKVMIGE
ncbi:BNR-4 repeat-containing protein [Hyunsoonleella rubra]|uniref:BNR-4 repeat-containing protein n=1 Tax=Hyunsoonleella rubra TaxID=1737062 RepID=A0ABW5TF57_9FLAO